MPAVRRTIATSVPRGTAVAILRRTGGIAYVVPLGDAATGDPFTELTARGGAAAPAREEAR